MMVGNENYFLEENQHLNRTKWNLCRKVHYCENHLKTLLIKLTLVLSGNLRFFFYVCKVLTDAGVKHRAMCMLCTMHQMLKGDSALDARLTMLEDRLRTA